MRKFAFLLFCLGLAGALCISAPAAGTAEIVRAFVYEGTLYTYVSIAAGGELICRAEAQTELPELTGEVKRPAEPQPPDTSQLPDPLPESPAGTPGGGEAAPAAPAAEQKSPPVGLIAGAAVLALAVIAAAAVLLRKKKAPAADVPPAPSEPARQTGIYMRLELVRGALADGQEQRELELKDELIIGADPACDIAVCGEAASRHARLFVLEGTVCPEALASPGTTLVNGETLSQTRLLRSGDEITTGDVVIRLKF